MVTSLMLILDRLYVGLTLPRHPVLTLVGHDQGESVWSCSFLLLQQLNFQLFGVPYSVGIAKSNLLFPWLNFQLVGIV